MANGTRIFERFRGVDFSSGESQVAVFRAAQLKNMYYDYESEQGGAIETIVGFRLLAHFSGKKTHGIYEYKPADGELLIVIHAGTSLFTFAHADRDLLTDEPERLTEYTGLSDIGGSAFMYNNKFWLLDGGDYWCLYNGEFERVSSGAYLPTTYINGEEYEQRNMLNNQTVNRDTQALEYEPLIELYEYGSHPDLKDLKYDHWLLGFSEGYSADKVYAEKKYVAPAAFKDNADIREVWCENLQYGEIAHHNVNVMLTGAFEGCKSLEAVFLPTPVYPPAEDKGIPCNTFKNCEKLHTVYLGNQTRLGSWKYKNPGDAEGAQFYSAFVNCPALRTIYVSWKRDAVWGVNEFFDYEIPAGVTVVYETPTPKMTPIAEVKEDDEAIWRTAVCYDPADSIEKVSIDDEETNNYITVWKTIEDVRYVERIYFRAPTKWEEEEIDIILGCKPSEFNTAEGREGFFEGNPDYSGTAADAVAMCTVSATYDGRIFLTGNPSLPNTVFYAQRDLTGATNPSYFGTLNYFNDGTGSSINRAMLSAAGMLMVFKGDTLQDGSVYYHEGADTGDDVVPRIYPSTQGVAGLGCVGSAVNFFDDPVFLSRRGLEAIGKQQVNLERTIQHRSSMIDSMLILEDLKNAVMTEWRGYLAVFCPSGRVYLADSRQMFERLGAAEYEWFLLDDIGIYKNQIQDYRVTSGGFLAYTAQGAEVWLDDSEIWVVHDGVRKPAVCGGGAQGYIDSRAVYTSYVYTAQEGADVLYIDGVPLSVFVALYDDKIRIVEPSDRYIDGEFSAATAAHAVIDSEVLYFGTADGHICCFNNDKRGVDVNGESVASDKIHRDWYTNNGRTIISSLTTAYDDAGAPGLAKKTVKKSALIRTKIFDNSRFDVYARTDRVGEWQLVSQIFNGAAQHYDPDFGIGSLRVDREGMYTVGEREKRWSQKQYRIESAYHKSPFGLYAMSYRYIITGGVKI